MRSFGGLVVGIIAAFIAAMVIASIGGALFPMRVDPAIQDPTTQLREAFPRAPLAAQLFVALYWFTGGFVGALVAKAMSRLAWPAWTVAGIMTLFAVLHMLVLPLPTWMQIGAVALPLVGGLLGVHLVPDRKVATAEPAPGNG